MKSFVLISGLLVLLLGGGPRPAPPSGDALVWNGSTNGPPGTVFVVVAPDSDEPGEVHVVNKQPRVWIGVRGTPIPDALAAHIGTEGVMVANVVADSPADRAGIDRYDVILEFNGTPTNTMQELVDAIAAAGAGGAAEIELLREAKRQSVTVTLENRPGDAAVEFKYEEPRASSVDSGVQYFGHRLSKDAQGNWMLEPLGNLQGMPESVKDMVESAADPAWNQWLGDAWDSLGDPVRMRIQVDPADPSGGMMFFDPGDAADDASVRIVIEHAGDDGTIRIVRNADGAVEVRRTDASGSETTSAYSDLDALRAEDPDAYAMYRRYSGFRARPFVYVPPTMNRLPDLQLDFQREIQERLERLRGRLDRTQDTTSRTRDMLRNLQHGIGSGTGDAQLQIESTTVTDGVETSTRIQIDNGRVTVVERTGDEERTYEFDSLEALKREEPQLFERVPPLLRER